MTAGPSGREWRATIGEFSLAILLPLLALICPSPGFAANAPADSLAVIVYELQRAGRFGEARDVAAELIGLRQTEKARAWKVADARRFLAAAETCLALTGEHAQALGRMYVLADSIPTLLRGGRFDEARALAERRLELCRQILPPGDAEELNALSDLAVSHLELGNYREALAIYEGAVPGFLNCYGELHPQTARAFSNVAVSAGFLGRYERAAELLRLSLAIRTDLFGPDHLLVGKTLHSLGSILVELGRSDEAEDILRKALSIRRQNLALNHRDVANTRDSLANLLRGRGDLVAAEPLYREAVAAKVEALGDDHPQTARSWNSLAQLRREQGFWGEARSLHQRALDIQLRSLGEEHPDVATTHYSLGTLERRSGNLDQAGFHFRLALHLRRDRLGPDHSSVARAQNGLGLTLLEQGRPEEAVPLFVAALATDEAVLGDDHPDLAPVLANLARAQEQVGDGEQALELARKAVRLEQRRVGGEVRHAVDSYMTLARLEHSRGSTTASAKTLGTALDIYEAAQARVGFGLGRAMFAHAPYRFLAAVHLERGDSLAAWEVTERSLGRLLADLLFQSRTGPREPLEAKEEERLARELWRKERSWTRAIRTGVDRNEDTRREAEAELLRAQANWIRLQDQLSQAHPVQTGAGFSLARIQGSLSEDEAIVGWLETSDIPPNGRSWAYVIRRSGSVRWIETQSVKERARELRDLLFSASTWPLRVEDTTRIDELGRKIWRSKIAPLANDLEGALHLLVVSDGELAGVPLDAIPAGDGRPLGEHYRVSYLLSATSLAWSRENPSGDESSGALLIGDPEYREVAQLGGPSVWVETEESGAGPAAPARTSGGLLRTRSFPQLPGTRAEVEQLSELLPGATVWLGPAACEDSLSFAASERRLLRYRRIHIATHARLDESRPEKSALILSSPPVDSEFDGRLTVEEILREWDLDADLVTLSSCQSALGPRVSGEGFLGLVQAMLQAGARSVVVSLWPVDDRASALLMGAFYRTLLEEEGLPRAEALRRARLQLRNLEEEDGSRPFRHPAYWAPFILIGDPS